ncbi:MAG: response regulator [Candidatus Omnitrophica bacterium]|nr:response regulator [Candidatus Omnitrophota bacterium]
MTEEKNDLVNCCKGLHVLVVEDIKPNRDLIKAYFDILGCTADYAYNGLEAVNKVKANKYDLCLMDFQMPVMGGLEATRIIRQELGSQMWIIALTGSATREQLKEGLCIGMNSCCVKPIRLEELARAILLFKDKDPSQKF